MALTFPRPIRHFDIDVGGFNRATWANLPKPRIDLTDIESKSYRVPIGMERFMSAPQGQPTIRFPKRITGYREAWQDVLVDFVECVQNPDIKTIVIDSATALWEICHKGYLQEKQEIQLAQGVPETADHFRERLQPVEFPNDRMNQVIYTAQSFDKNLVMIHYPKDEYVTVMNEKGKKEDQRSGRLILDGFKHTEKVVDIVFWLDLKTKQVQGGLEVYAQAKVSTKCGFPGLGTAALGWELPSPTYQGIVQLYKLINGIEE